MRVRLRERRKQTRNPGSIVPIPRQAGPRETRRISTRAALCPALVFQILQKIPRGHSERADQLKRATISIPLNIAEGAAKPSDKDRSRFHAIARGSAMECGAIVDIMHLQDLAEPKTLTEAKSLLVRLVSMLSKMCR